MAHTNIVIVGAGPYGLAIAAHLHARRVPFRIFGSPMLSWSAHTPKGMHLKSEGFASNLYAPGDAFPLSRYCADHAIPYADVGLPVSAETFVEYGLDFQRRYVPNLEDRQLVALAQSGAAFDLAFDDGERLTAETVVLATGLGAHARMPAELAGLPRDRVSHSWQCGGLDQHAGRQVVVIGSGASALDCAATLLQGNAEVSVLTRSDVINFHSPPADGRRSLREMLFWPRTGLGPGWASMASCKGPRLIHALPERTRHDFVRRHLGPAPCWFVRDQVVGHASLHTGVSLAGAEMAGGRVQLHSTRATGEAVVLHADHVLAATGFEVDLRNLAFLSPGLLGRLRMEDHKPALSSNFESSVRGLHFAGPASAASFGPLLRFAYGARFAARRIARHLA